MENYSFIKIFVHALLVRSLGKKFAMPNAEQCINLNINQSVNFF